MNELIQQVRDLVETPVNILGEPIKVFQIVSLILTLIATLLIAGVLHRWFRRLFNRLRISTDIQNRLLVLLFLIIMLYKV